MRTITQINTTAVQEGFTTMIITTVLCDDGSIWQEICQSKPLSYAQSPWRQLDGIPEENQDFGNNTYGPRPRIRSTYKRKVLKVDFHSEDSPSTYQYQEDLRRRTFLTWLREEGLMWHPCRLRGKETSYLGQVYIDIDCNLETNLSYHRLLDYLLAADLTFAKVSLTELTSIY